MSERRRSAYDAPTHKGSGATMRDVLADTQARGRTHTGYASCACDHCTADRTIARIAYGRTQRARITRA